jgi:hypothetical protein
MGGGGPRYSDSSSVDHGDVDTVFTRVAANLVLVTVVHHELQTVPVPEEHLPRHDVKPSLSARDPGRDGVMDCNGACNIMLPAQATLGSSAGSERLRAHRINLKPHRHEAAAIYVANVSLGPTARGLSVECAQLRSAE